MSPRRRLNQIQLVRGPNKILLTLTDVTFINPSLSNKVIFLAFYANKNNKDTHWGLTRLPKTRKWVWRKARPVIQEKASQSAATTLHSPVNLQPPMKIQMLLSMRYNIFKKYFKTLNRTLTHLKTVHFLKSHLLFCREIGLGWKDFPMETFRVSTQVPLTYLNWWVTARFFHLWTLKVQTFFPYNCYQVLVITNSTFSKTSVCTHINTHLNQSNKLTWLYLSSSPVGLSN